eukprot:scaffold6756_cov90-Alexandrium_tamarense.AAC.1
MAPLPLSTTMTMVWPEEQMAMLALLNSTLLRKDTQIVERYHPSALPWVEKWATKQRCFSTAIATQS